LIATDNGNADRDVLNVLGAPLRSHDDLFDLV